MSVATPVVSSMSLFFMCVTLLVCIGLPVALAIWAKVRYKKSFSFLPLLAGVLGFLISQVIFRLPVLQYLLPMFDWYKSFSQMSWSFLIFLCFTAGLVEEPARFIAFTIMKKRRQYPDGLSYGIGHGGFEAIVITGVAMLNNIVLSLMINSGSAASLGGVIPQSAINALVDTPSYMFLLGGMERIFAVTLHIALSLFVLRGFQVNRRWLYLLGAILLHGCANLLGVGAMQLAGPWASEGVLLVIAVLSLLYIVKQARNWRKSISEPQGLPEFRTAE